MEVKVEGNEVRFSGVLDEGIAQDVIESVLKEAQKNCKDQRILVDYSEVKRANSCGILTWLQVTSMGSYPITYVNVPVWLIAQFNMIEEFMMGDITISSIQAPFYCPDTDETTILTLKVGEDIPVQEQYDDFEFPVQTIDGKEYEPDFEPSDYFLFITFNIERFRRTA